METHEALAEAVKFLDDYSADDFGTHEAFVAAAILWGERVGIARMRMAALEAVAEARDEILGLAAVKVVNAAREFWTQDNNGRDVVVAITHTADDAAVVWDAVKRARAYVEEREHRESYRGRFIRSWDEQDGMLWRSDLEARGVSLS